MSTHGWAVQLEGVEFFGEVKARVLERYPQARIQPLDTPGYVGIILPQQTWYMAPEGEEGFFADLYGRGLCTAYQKARVDGLGV